MRIAIVTSVHRWDDPRIFHRQAKTLAEQGWDVSLHAPGAGAPSIRDSVTVSGPPKPAGRLQRMTMLQRTLIRLVPADADIIHIHDPELLLWFACRMLRRRRAKLVYDAHEDYPAQLQMKPWIPRILRSRVAAVLGRCELAVARRCGLVVAATPAIARRFTQCTVVVAQNYPVVVDLPEVRPSENTGRFEFVHVGELNRLRGADSLQTAMASQAVHDVSIGLRQLGPVKPAGELQPTDNVSLDDAVPHEEALRVIGSADAGLILFRHGPNHDESQPNKLFEYLVMGLPVLASDFAHWRTIAQECDALVVFVDPANSAAVAEGLVHLRHLAQRHDRLAQAQRARSRFDWEIDSGLLLAAYARIAEPDALRREEFGSESGRRPS